MQRRQLVQAAGALALGTPFVLRAQSPVNLRMQGFLPAASPTHRAFEKFAADLKAESNGRVNIAVLPVGGAVAPGETISAIGNGILDGHYSSPSFFASRDPAFTLLGDTGAAYDDVVQRDRWFREGGGIPVAREVYDKYGLYYVDQIFWPSEHIPSRRALNGVADLRGLKIRVPPGMIAEIFGRAGASVVNLPATEVFNALQSGVIDATDWASPGQNLEVGLYRAAKFSVNAAHSMPTTEMSFSKRKWGELPAEVRQLIEAGIVKMNTALQGQIRADDDAALKKMAADGVQIVNWTKDEIAKLRTLTGQAQADLGSRNDLARKVLDSHRAFMTRLGYKAV